MADATAYLKVYNVQDYPVLQRVNRSEVLRYAGMMDAARILKKNDDDTSQIDAEILVIMEDLIEEVMPLLTYKVSYRYDTIHWNDEDLELPFDTYGSVDLRTNLRGCDELVSFAATVGIGIDRLIGKYNHTSPVKALFLQAIGAERIESLCDLFNNEIRMQAAEEGRSTKPRFSPGYGDLPLEVQKQFMVLLDCSRRLGVNLNESLLMSPSKSVTAVIGIGAGDLQSPVCDQRARRGNDIQGLDSVHNCNNCSKIDCEYRDID